MVAERGVELDTGFEQIRVRFFEFVGKVFGRFSAVQVVTGHQDDVEGERFLKLRQHRAYLILFLAAGAGVADDREMEGCFAVGKR